MGINPEESTGGGGSVSVRTRITKRRLYEAAAEIIGTRGFDDTTVDDIVEKAGMAKGTVYYHFASKSELVQALITELSAELIRDFGEIEQRLSDDPYNALLELMRAQLCYLTDNPAFSRLLTAELWRTDRPWHEALMTARKALVDTICRVVKKGIERGTFQKAIDPDFAGYALFGLTTYVALDRLAHEPDRPYDDLVAQMEAVVKAAVSQPN